MPRAKRKQSGTGIYHIVLRGVNQQSIFEDDEDNEYFLELLSDVKATSGFKLYAYCLMGNHVHLLLKESDEPLSQIFRRLNSRYAQWFNWKYQRSGHLFQDRFRSETVEDDAYFVTVIRYIHDNPRKAGMTKKPEIYRWSSLADIDKKDGIVDWNCLESIISIADAIPPKQGGKNNLIGDYAKAYKRTIGENTSNKDIGISVGSGRTASHFKRTPLDIMTRIPSERLNVLSDYGARAALKQLCGADGASSFQKLATDRQRTMLPKLRKGGLSIRQIARITGLSRGVVARWSKG